MFFEVTTYRWQEHVGPGRDYQLGYRSESECEPWMAADPLKQLAEELDHDERTQIEAEVEDEVAAAFAFADSSPYPEAAELMTEVLK